MSFDTLAPHYRWMEVVLAGPLLQRCRTEYLDEVSGAREVLVLGPGRSGFTRALLDCAPAAHATLVDSSPGMLARLGADLAARGVPASRFSLVCADVRTWNGPPEAVDVVATHFFLDCFAPAELDAVVARVAGWTRPGARWLLSDFQVPPRGWQRYRARSIHALMYAFFRPATGISARRVTPPDEPLAGAGFLLEHRRTSNHGLLHADLWRRVH